MGRWGYLLRVHPGSWRSRIPTKALALESATLSSSVRWACKDAVLTRSVGPGPNTRGMFGTVGDLDGDCCRAGGEPGLVPVRGSGSVLRMCALCSLQVIPQVMKPQGERAKPWPTGWARMGPGWEVWGQTRAQGEPRGLASLEKVLQKGAHVGQHDARRWWECLQQAASERPEDLTWRTPRPYRTPCWGVGRPLGPTPNT